MGIEWTAFSWEAFSTIFVGLLAVGGATIVGWRQVGIQQEQTRILEGQVRLDSLRYNAELFDRRLEVYQGTARYLSSIAQNARKPDPELEREFLLALNMSKFLFSPNVHDQLKQIWKDSVTYGYLSKQVEQKWDRSGGGEWTDLVDKERTHFEGLTDRLNDLDSIFGSEMKLGNHQL